jgi:hypothetical protein
MRGSEGCNQRLQPSASGVMIEPPRLKRGGLTDTVKPKVATTPTEAHVSIRHFVALHLFLAGASALLTALWTFPLLVIVAGTSLVLGFSKLADSWLAPFIAISSTASTLRPSRAAGPLTARY